MTGRRLLRFGFGLLAMLAIATAVSAFTASNSVPLTHAGQSMRTVGPNDVKPSSCAALTLAATVVGVTGTNGADLLLGTGAVETLRGNQGNDCILAGGGIDTLRGDAGTDVCIGGPGVDVFDASCETQIQ